MRILVVGAVSGATVDIGSSLAHAFVSLGEECHFLDFSEYQQELRIVNAARIGVDMHGFLIKLQTRLLEEVLLFNPSLIIGLAQSPLDNIEVLDSFRKSNSSNILSRRSPTMFDKESLASEGLTNSINFDDI